MKPDMKAEIPDITSQVFEKYGRLSFERDMLIESNQRLTAEIDAIKAEIEKMKGKNAGS